MALLVPAVLIGCQPHPQTLSGGLQRAAVRGHVRDAHLGYVDGHPALRTDDASLQQLELALGAEALPDAKAHAMRFLDAAQAQALAAAEREWFQLAGPAREKLAARYLEPDRGDEALGRIRLEIDRDAAELETQIDAAKDMASLRAVLTPLHEDTEVPVKHQGRLARMLPWLLFTPFSKGQMNEIYEDEYRGNADVAFDQAVVYRPSRSTDGVDDDDEASELLQRYAPIIVQETTPADAAYDPAVDRIGHVVAANADHIDVLTNAAQVYAYSRDVIIDGASHRQLTYTHWYPKHPALKPKDPEAGHIEGVTFRITLDRAQQPAIFETLSNCGCYHRLYPTDRLEASALSAFGGVVSGKKLAIERAVPGRKDLIVPNAVETGGDAQAHPVIRVRSGWHGIVDVGYRVDKHPEERHATTRYTLQPYDRLEALPTPDGGVTSMFYDNGLVKEAQRREGVYFTPAGVLSAGQPRQRGTQLIHWDDWDFDDPSLFEQALRLPERF